MGALAILLIGLALSPAANAAQTPLTNTGLDLGYRQIYNLDFAAAHATFQSWMSTHPADPMGPASDAVVYLFAEMNRLHILQMQFFVHDSDFLSGPKGVTDPGFVRDVMVAESLASKTLASSPNNTTALYVQALCHGMRADNLALIHKRNLASLGEMKQGAVVAQHLLSLDPNYGDAYLAVGIENYVLGLRSAPVRWLLRLDGASTDKNAGLEQLRHAAVTGHYLRPYAQILLAIAAVRDQQPQVARGLLEHLTGEFPHNPLYAQELARLGRDPDPAATLDPATTVVHYSLGAFLHTVHGTFQVEHGELRWGVPNGTATGEIVIAAASGSSGNTSRDRDMRDNVLEAAKFPEITFTTSGITGEVARTGESHVVIHGTLRLHGADHQLDLPLDVKVSGDHFTAAGSLEIPYVAWGLHDPSNAILHVGKTVKLTLDAAGAINWQP